MIEIGTGFAPQTIIEGRVEHELDCMKMRIKHLLNSFSRCKNKLCAIPHIRKCEKNNGVKVPKVLLWLLYSANGNKRET
ncbi:hypothetical protein C8R32_1016 [Nitrosospira sp. Nsp5]|uniref:Uncharacterized protein n=1 Tax=Nitrosospira multiformis TaxID=1231 RepID=A0ABY0TH81_9PROT|nr:hypothetical protein C8R32_1016 [Nitrosospira sp. Nsp5]SDQ82874.1 hypothetical protein SAMN05216402_2457 [Nitrosospira multiformis]